MKSIVFVAASAAAVIVAPSALGSMVIYSYDFTPSLTVDFDGLATGPIVGDTPIVPGASISYDNQGDLANVFVPRGGQVVDEGSGDHALNLFNLGAAPAHYSIVLKFDTPFVAFAATWTYLTGGDDFGNPAYEVFDAAGNLVESLGDGSPDESPFVFGLKDMATPATYLALNWSAAGANSEDWNIDDVAVQQVPAPGALALMGLGGIASLRRRR